MHRALRSLLVSVSALLLLGSPLASASHASGADDRLAVVSTAAADPDNLLVRFKDGIDQSKVKKLLNKHKLTETEEFDDADVTMYDIGTSETPATVAKALTKAGVVELAEPDYRVTIDGISNDARVDEEWGLKNFGQSVSGQAGTSGVDIDAVNAWPKSTGNNVIVAVLDEGVDTDHPELSSHIWTNMDDCFADGIDHDNNGYINDCRGWDFYNNDASVFDAEDGDDHGTHVAGTVAASLNNNVGVAGVAPNASIMPLKFLGPNGGSTSDAIRGIAYAKANGAKIVNCSWGGSAFSQALKDAVADSGMFFAVAAGNSGTSNASSPQYPASFDLPNLVSVAAVDNTGALASFSNYAGTTAVGAPGVNILSTVPKKRAVSVGVQNANTSGSWKTAFWGFGLEAVSGTTSRRDLLVAELQRMGATATNAPIMLIDDDESSSGSSLTPDTASYYTSALAAAGYTNVTVNTVPKNASGPSNSSLAGHYVIWQTGYAVGSTGIYTLTGSDLVNLGSFVNSGGKLLVAGADAIWRNESATFVSTYLGVTFIDEGDTRTAAYGVSGTNYAGLSPNINGAESPKTALNPYQDTVKPTGAYARSVLELASDADHSTAYEYKSGTSMASPHVAAIAALCAEVDTAANASMLASYVKQGVRSLGSLGNGVTTTGGMVVASNSVNVALGNTNPGSQTPPGGASSTSPGNVAISSTTAGYRFVASDGGIFSYGNAVFAGSAGGEKLNAPIVAMSATPSGNGYWLAGSDGGIYNYGDAAFKGSTGGAKLNQPIVGMSGMPDGNGYWLVASDGGIFSYGSAAFHGSTGAIKLNKPIVAMASTPSGNGYWLVASDGGIFSYGDAGFFGSTGAIKLNQPIVAMAPTATGKGYWLVASDGGIFAFGDAAFHGSAGSIKLNQPIVGMSTSASGNGYWLVASDGGIFSYGDAAFYGSTGSIKLNKPIVGMTR